MKEELNKKRVELNEEALEEVNAGFEMSSPAGDGFFQKIWKFFRGIGGDDQASGNGGLRLNDTKIDKTTMLADDKVMMLADDELHDIG